MHLSWHHERESRGVSECEASLGRLLKELVLLSYTWSLPQNEVPGAAVLLRWQSVAELGDVQNCAVRLLGLPRQWGICSFVFLKNYAGLLIASFVELFASRPVAHCLSGLDRSER